MRSSASEGYERPIDFGDWVTDNRSAVKGEIVLTRSLRIFLILTCTASFGGVIAYDGTLLPENDGWTRLGTLDAVRSVEDGWFSHTVSIPGQLDAYQRSLAEFAGTPEFFVEWRVETDADPSLLDSNLTPVVLALGGTSFAYYHVTMTDGRVLLNRSNFLPPVYVSVEGGEPHSYRIELFGDEFYRWLIDGTVVDSGVPVAAYPTSGSELAWGIHYSVPGHSAQWDYIRYGAIPEPATGALLLLGSFLITRRRLNRG